MSKTDILKKFKYPENIKGWQLSDITSYIKVFETKQFYNKQTSNNHFFYEILKMSKHHVFPLLKKIKFFTIFF